MINIICFRAQLPKYKASEIKMENIWFPNKARTLEYKKNNIRYFLMRKIILSNIPNRQASKDFTKGPY
ncbi:hypothetical protein CWI39_1108p0010 [Hamiltosporidium magnivora]|uniref:Uncharacterized protein n=1 Tax=Hamiltosporidium magnivora TaxID=148818 RepID=A0A4Q9L542_9MICR|nr:hypothetical protein CWI39_1108p0010 [Hamiltosporidium magnivora]